MNSPPESEPGATEELLIEDRWEELLERVSPMLKQALSGKIPRGLRKRFDTDDALQEGFLALRGQAQKFSDQGPGSARRWMVTVIKHRLLDLVRYHQALRRAPHAMDGEDLTPGSGSYDPSSIVEQLDEISDLLVRVENLPPQRKELIERIFFKQQRMSEVSIELGIPRQTLRKWLTETLENIGRARGAKG